MFRLRLLDGTRRLRDPGEPVRQHGGTVGVDLGLKHLVALDRAITRCENGSKNRAELLRRRATLVKVGRSYPSSQTCSGCGARTKLALWQRVYHCTDCGLTLDRDVNAARNIRAEGQRLAREQHHVASIRGETRNGEPRPDETEPAPSGVAGRGSFEAATGPAAIPVAAA